MASSRALTWPLSALLFLCFALSATATSKVMVDVYYESLCPDSMKLITMQITPVYNSPLGAYMNLTLIPYGKADMNKTGEEYFFTCHHGKRECEGNKVHACALHYLADSQDKQVKFINCTMTENQLKDTDQEYRVQTCGEMLSVQWKDIQNCANLTEGEQLLAAQGEITKKLQNPLQSVPTVVFNSKFDEKANKDSRSDFKGGLCARVEGGKAPGCGEAPRKNAAPATLTATLLPILGALALYRL